MNTAAWFDGLGLMPLQRVGPCGETSNEQLFIEWEGSLLCGADPPQFTLPPTSLQMLSRKGKQTRSFSKTNKSVIHLDRLHWSCLRQAATLKGILIGDRSKDRVMCSGSIVLPFATYPDYATLLVSYQQRRVQRMGWGWEPRSLSFSYFVQASSVIGY